jgi:hypothetical protein
MAPLTFLPRSLAGSKRTQFCDGAVKGSSYLDRQDSRRDCLTRLRAVIHPDAPSKVRIAGQQRHFKPDRGGCDEEVRKGDGSAGLACRGPHPAGELSDLASRVDDREPCNELHERTPPGLSAGAHQKLRRRHGAQQGPAGPTPRTNASSRCRLTPSHAPTPDRTPTTGAGPGHGTSTVAAKHSCCQTYLLPTKFVDKDIRNHR